MRRAATSMAMLAVVALGWWTQAAAGDREPCDCNGSYSGEDNFWTSSRRPRWAMGADNCPPPPLDYFSPRARWYIASDIIALKRDPSDERPIATLGATDNVVLSTSDLRNEFEAGARLTVGRRLSDWYAIEATYFGLTTWNAFAAVRDDTVNINATEGNLFSPFSNFGNPAGVIGLDFNALASIENRSSLDNFEISLRQQVDLPPSGLGASMLYGVRMMNLRETFRYRTESASPVAGSINDISVDTDNDLIGFQLGSVLEFQIEDRGWITVEMKGVVAHNGAGQVTTGDLEALATPLDSARDETRTAFVGDISVALVYRFTPGILGRIGYQSMWVDGVALASENLQADPDLLTLGPPQLVHDGSVVYHGPFAGLMFTW